MISSSLLVVCLLLLACLSSSANEKLLTKPGDGSVNANDSLTGILPKTVCLDIDIADNSHTDTAPPESSKVFVKVVNFDNVTICEKIVLEKDKFMQCQVPLDYVSEGHNVFYVSLYDVDTGAELGKLDSTFFISNDAEVTQWKRQKKRMDLATRMKRLEVWKKVTASLALAAAATLLYLWATQNTTAVALNNADGSGGDNDDAFFRPPRPWWQRVVGRSDVTSSSVRTRRSGMQLGALVGAVGIGLLLVSSQNGVSLGGINKSPPSTAIGTSAASPNPRQSTPIPAPPTQLLPSQPKSQSPVKVYSKTASVSNIFSRVPSLFTAMGASLRAWSAGRSTGLRSNSSILRNMIDGISRRLHKLWNDFLDD